MRSPKLEHHPRFYGLHLSEWPTGVRNQFMEFLRIGLRYGVSSAKAKRMLTSPKSEIAYRNLVSLLLGYVRDHEEVDTTAWNLRDNLLTAERITQFVTWHATRTGEVRAFHQMMYDQAARLVRTLGGDLGVAIRLESLADQQDPQRVRVINVQDLLDYDVILAGARDCMEAGEKAFADWVRSGEDPHQAKDVASFYQDCLLFFLAVRRPLRGCNLAMMRAGQHVRQKEGKWLLAFSATEIKGKHPYDGPFPPDVVPHLVRFLKDVRPLLDAGRYHNLFLTRAGGKLTHRLLSDRLIARGQTFLGVHSTPHFFRHLVVSAYLTKYPQEIDVARALLGHACVETTLTHYAHLRVRDATLHIKPFLRETCPHFKLLGDLQFPG